MQNRFGIHGKFIFCAIALLLIASFQPALAADPINIGYTADFSGVDATLTMVQAPVVEMIVKEVNAAGGINGRQINLIIQDNGSDPAKAVGNVKMFREQYHCNAIIAGGSSTVNLALKAWAEKNHVSIIAMDPQSDKLWDKTGKSWHFRTSPPASLLVQGALVRMKKLGYTKIGFEGTTLAWGSDTLKTLKEEAPKYGITLVAESPAEPKTKDLTIQAKKLKDSGAQAVLCAEYTAETAVFARALNQVGWKPLIIHISGANINSAMLLGSPEMFNGWETVTTADSTKPLVQAIWAKTEKYTGKKIDHDEKAVRTYDAVSLLIAALKASGNVDDPTAIRDAYYKLNNYEWGIGQKGAKGGFVTGRNHLLTAEGIVAYSIKDGKMIPVE